MTLCIPPQFLRLMRFLWFRFSLPLAIRSFWLDFFLLQAGRHHCVHYFFVSLLSLQPQPCRLVCLGTGFGTASTSKITRIYRAWYAGTAFYPLEWIFLFRG